jgi:Aldo/keto reductase family
MDAAVDAGINDFDTADVCGGPQAADMTKGYRVSEEVIGRWLRRSGRRDEIVPATTVYQPRGLGPSDRRLSAYHLRRACDIPMEQHRRSHRLPPLSSERRGHVGGSGETPPQYPAGKHTDTQLCPGLRLPPS